MAIAAAAAALGRVPDCAGQALSITGRVLHGGPQGRPVPRHWVVLHAVTRDGAGPVDSTRTDPRGGYRLRVARPDTAALYYVSALFSGVAYFSAPLRAGQDPATTQPPLLVYDTASVGPPIRLDRRLIAVHAPGDDGTREVLELLEVVNPGPRTRVAADTTRAVWGFRVPAEGIQFAAGEGDVSPEAVRRVGDTVALFAPLPPNELKQVSVAYILPADVRDFTVPVDQWVGELDLLLADTATRVTGVPLDTLGVQALEPGVFAAYRSDSLAAGAAPRIQFPRAGPGTQLVVVAVVVLVAGALAAGLVIALRRPRPGPAAPSAA